MNSEADVCDDFAALLRAREEAKPDIDEKPRYSWGADGKQVVFLNHDVHRYADHPPTESAEAKDAAWYRWLRDENNGAVISVPIEDDFLVLSGAALDRHIAAMTAESREGEES
jgi:hypothetical protein